MNYPRHGSRTRLLTKLSREKIADLHLDLFMTKNQHRALPAVRRIDYDGWI